MFLSALSSGGPSKQFREGVVDEILLEVAGLDRVYPTAAHSPRPAMNKRHAEAAAAPRKL